jgi:hypothetical protein
MLFLGTGGEWTMLSRSAVGCAVSVLLSSCASLDLIHDPQTGVIDRSQVRGFIKSVRCELKTFYELNSYNSRHYKTENAKYVQLLAEAANLKKQHNMSAAEADEAKAGEIRASAIAAYPHFLLSPDLFGGVFLDLKVLDTLGIGAGDTTDTWKRVRNATHSLSWVVAPTANTANTYEMNYSFIIDQSTGLAKADMASDDDGFKCYSGLSPEVDLNALADGRYPQSQNYIRILVNGVRPLAAWLLDNSKDLWDNFRARSDLEEKEQIIGTQMNYNFMVQITGGVDVRYSLVSSLWNPAQIGGQLSSVQTSQMQFFLNGYDASLPGGTKTGTAINAASPPGPGGPPYIPIGQLDQMIKDTQAKIEQAQTTLQTEGVNPAAAKARADLLVQLNTQLQGLQSLRTKLQSARVPAPAGIPGNSRGYLSYPPAILPP